MLLLRPSFFPTLFLSAASAVTSSLSFLGDGVNSPFPSISAWLHVSLLIRTLFSLLLLLPNMHFEYLTWESDIRPVIWLQPPSRFAVCADIRSLWILSSASVARLRVVGFTAAVAVWEICAAC